jgi:hypothetical protein
MQDLCNTSSSTCGSPVCCSPLAYMHACVHVCWGTPLTQKSQCKHTSCLTTMALTCPHPPALCPLRSGPGES